jgi:hypothetical protein
MYYIKLSGFIPENKQMEFEQTYRYATTQIPRTCSGYSMSKDTLYEGLYHFISYWAFQESLQSFTQSVPFFMMIGAIKSLGELRENTIGEMIQEPI